MTVPEITYTIILIVGIVILFTLYIVELIKSLRAGSTRRRAAIPALTLGFLLCVYLVLNVRAIEPAALGQILLMFGLVLVTVFYALSAYRQADASVKMAEEMREQRLIGSRPIIIQKAIHEKDVFEGSTSEYFNNFEIYNAGKSPAIELEISLQNKERVPLHSIRQTFLRADDLPINFRPFNLGNLEESTYYLVSEYQSIFSRGSQKVLYQTLLPFEPVKSSKEGKIYLKAGELEFHEVTGKERIDAFSSRSKPQ